MSNNDIYLEYGTEIKYLEKANNSMLKVYYDTGDDEEPNTIWYIRDRIHQINHSKYVYKGHYYTVLQNLKMKNPSTGEWQEAVLYTDGKGTYVREARDFFNKFLLK